MRLREDKERAERALQEMRVRHNETEAGAQVRRRYMHSGTEELANKQDQRY